MSEPIDFFNVENMSILLYVRRKKLNLSIIVCSYKIKIEIMLQLRNNTTQFRGSDKFAGYAKAYYFLYY